jgi:hypothetical protein
METGVADSRGPSTREKFKWPALPVWDGNPLVSVGVAWLLLRLNGARFPFGMETNVGDGKRHLLLLQKTVAQSTSHLSGLFLSFAPKKLLGKRPI